MQTTGKRWKRRCAGMLALTLVALQAQAEPEDKTLRLYNWADYFAADTLARFTAETGIRVIYDVMAVSYTHLTLPTKRIV